MIVYCSAGRTQRKQSFLRPLFVMAIVKKLNKVSFPNWLLAFLLLHTFPEALTDRSQRVLKSKALSLQ